MNSYNDYPIKVIENARLVLKWKEQYPEEVTAMTPVGWKRARQLANKEKLSIETIKRMASFIRHQKNKEINPIYKDTPWKDNGYVAWLGWGGDEGIEWAINKIKIINLDKIITKTKDN